MLRLRCLHLFVLDVAITKPCAIQGKICAANCLITCKVMKQCRLVHACTISFIHKHRNPLTDTHHAQKNIHIHYTSIYKVRMCKKSTNWWSFPPALAIDPGEHTKLGDCRNQTPPTAYRSTEKTQWAGHSER